MSPDARVDDVLSNPNFSKNSSMSATMSGSVGKLTPTPPRSNCSRLIDSGVAKTMKKQQSISCGNERPSNQCDQRQ
ncbi:MAG: hypothetical protein IPO90_07625 [Flavobacteriales bacterium]|nr:hypothetical protein [Flavobacteriales bacterium]